MKYVLITGASKGIGKAMAEILASKKRNLLLVARSSDLLESLAITLKTQYQIEADWLSVDFTQSGASYKIQQWCIDKNYSIDILINNAGYGLSGPFEKYAAKENLYRYKRQIVGLFCHIVFHFFGNFMPYPVFQDCFEMAARTPMKISTKIKEKNSGLIAGAPKKIHRQKQNISEKNIKK